MNRDDNAPDGWWELGNCRHLPNTEIDRLFFPPRHAGRATIHAEAKAICATCPVTAQCLDYALATDIRIGTYGGMTDLERRHAFHPGRRGRQLGRSA